MKKNILITSFFIGFLSFYTFAQAKTDIQCRMYFDKTKKLDNKEQKIFYETVEQCQSHLFKDKDLVLKTIEAYRALFKVNRSHFHLEPFMPFYIKNKKQVDDLVSAITDKAEREDFQERLKTAYREFNDGNG
ncbi:hypothetical protein M899_1840 [Bacteriovorax sp. BSW11_IV]|uniref:hypothetical protein n=1 Tax=Bacteriovorax sp. BSW11_IV TaxID=1353529 RepID=UPI00038A43FC|nr:hypothetical protein [Bacteriovorax sp. BSW11_IV]EQC48410.1 hypothetical protein M899_1840 [Bacteriovorax sp. BSW11_IV]